MTDIQQARDVLAKWRSESTQGDWHVGDRDPAPGWEHHRAVDVGPSGAITDYIDPGDARLIVGTAGNPESLDADDALLALALEYGDLPSGNGSRFIALAKRKAAAIVAADERMSA